MTNKEIRKTILMILKNKELTTKLIAKEIGKENNYTHNLLRKMCIEKSVKITKRDKDQSTNAIVSYWALK